MYMHTSHNIDTATWLRIFVKMVAQLKVCVIFCKSIIPHNIGVVLSQILRYQQTHANFIQNLVNVIFYRYLFNLGHKSFKIFPTSKYFGLDLKSLQSNQRQSHHTQFHNFRIQFKFNSIRFDLAFELNWLLTSIRMLIRIELNCRPNRICEVFVRSN